MYPFWEPKSGSFSGIHSAIRREPVRSQYARENTVGPHGVPNRESPAQTPTKIPRISWVSLGSHCYAASPFFTLGPPERITVATFTVTLPDGKTLNAELGASIGDVVKMRLAQLEHEQDALRDYIQTA